MYDFDRSLEMGLRLMLDPVVARRAPPRKKPLRRAGRIVQIAVAAEVVPMSEPLAVTVPVTPSRTP